MRRSCLLLLILPVLACAPAAGRETPEAIVRDVAPDSVQPPIVACAEAVLAGSSLVERFNSDRRPASRRGWYVVLRNPPGPHAKGFGLAVRPSRGTPRELMVSIPWPGVGMGEGGMKPEADVQTYDTEGEMLKDVALGLLQAVRSECAPAAPGEPACSKIAQGREARCSLGL